MSIKYGLRDLESEFGQLTFARVLRSHRQGEDMSQVEMAKILKISKQSLNDLESGRTLPSIARASAIAKLLGLMEATLVEVAIQDQMRREGVDLTVAVASRPKPKRRKAG